MLTLGALKLMGAGLSFASAWVVWRSAPEQVMKRRLDGLLRTNDFHIAHKGYKGGELRSYPTIKSVRTMLDRTIATFRIPIGTDPNEILKHLWLFRQEFGLNSELKQTDERTFKLSVYTTTVGMYEYEPLKVKEIIKGMKLPVYVGKNREGDVAYDMINKPNLLIAGSNDSGKSVALRNIITTLLINRDNVELYCADMKRTEFHLFKGIAKEVVIEKHGLMRIVKHLCKEMERRGDLLNEAEVAHVDDLKNPPPYIVLALDEVAALKQEKELMEFIDLIGAMGRALGMFLILSMQRPDAKLLEGSLKNNLNVRMAFRHPDEINSRISIGSGEAAHIKLEEKGKMVLKINEPEYVQGPLLTLDKATELLKPKRKTPEQIKAAEPIVEAVETPTVEWGEL